MVGEVLGDRIDFEAERLDSVGNAGQGEDEKGFYGVGHMLRALLFLKNWAPDSKIVWRRC